MKTFRSRSGPFVEQPYFTLADVEHIATDELQKEGLYPDSPGPIRIERFVEKRFQLGAVCYENLPDGVLGYTKFGPKGVEAVVVSHALAASQDRVSRRRVNTTLAHEAGHGLVHAPLFALSAADDVAPLFNGEFDKNVPKILCRDVQGVEIAASQQRYTGRWWELQANQFMSALLLPRDLVDKCIEPMLAICGSFGGKTLELANREKAAQQIADVFDVNPVVGRYRLQAIYPNDGNQLTF